VGYHTQSNILCVEAAREQGAYNRIITDYMDTYMTVPDGAFFPEAAALQLAANVAEHHCQSYVPRDVFRAL